MANPALNERVFAKLGEHASDQKMSITGTINKTGILLLCLIMGAAVGWLVINSTLILVSVVLTLILAVAIIFGPQRAVYLSQAYAFFEGLMLGTISRMYSFLYPGIVSNALMLTVTCLFVMLFLYRSKLIVVTEKFRTIIVTATIAIGATYLVEILLRLFHLNIPYIHEASPIGILFSVGVVVVAAFNLLIDFQNIEMAAHQQMPKYMEWYCAFGLLVTLVWLYLEILRLLGKISKKR